jgi:hypothetical protein
MAYLGRYTTGLAFPDQRDSQTTATGGGGIDYSDIIQRMEAQSASARQANIERGRRVENIYSEIIDRYRAGGAFEKAGLGEIAKGMTTGVGRESQQMISSGLYGTTTGAQVGRRWEESYAQPARLKLEDIMSQRLTAAQESMAGFLERIEEPYPDYGAVLPYLSQAATGGGGGGGGGAGGYGAMTAKNISGSVGGTQAWGSYGAPAHPDLAPTAEKKFIPQPLGLTANQLATGWGIGKRIKSGAGVTAGGQSAYLGIGG